MGKLKSSNFAGYFGVSTMKLAASEQESLVESLNLLQALMILMLRESVGRRGFNMFQLLSLWLDETDMNPMNHMNHGKLTWSMGRPRQVWKDVRALFGPTVVFVLGGPGAGKGGAKPLNPVSEVMVSQ